tara:strand:- start:70 stop:819 length:750 start_codon:yes stop_codon:yes gene_type:complete
MRDYKMKSTSTELYGDGIGSVEYVEHMGSDLSVVNSARVSFGSQKKDLDERDEKLISYLIKHKHTSTLEHCLITFRFVVPLFVRSQHHRHRTWSYNEISRRYTDVDISFYEPKEFRTQHESNRQASNQEDTSNPIVMWNEKSFAEGGGLPIRASAMVKDHHKQSLDVYHDLLDAGVCREQARGVLPQNMYTQYYGTVNLSNLIKFIELRTHEGAQWEIQKVAEACLKIATELFPITVGAYNASKKGKGE